LTIFMKNQKKVLKIIGVFLFAIMAYVLAPESMPETAKRMFSVFVFAAFFWGLSLIPLYATSVLVVLFEIFLLCRTFGPLSLPEPIDYKLFLLPLGNPIIVLFFGGFMLAIAMHKYKIDEFCSTRLLKIFGNKPFFLLLGFMLITGILSMWMSNTATSAMMIAMFIPIIKQLDEKDPFRIALILSIPFAANIGGIGTPIGTPPNAIALGILENHGVIINFFEWTKVAAPLAFVLLIVATIILYVMYPPKTRTIEFQFAEQAALSNQAKKVVWCTLITIVLWLTSGWHQLPSAIVALLAASYFISTEILSKDDVKSLDWDILILMWGGLALGKGMEISGLTMWIIKLPVFQQEGFVLISIFCLLALFLATFMSHTATANLMIPLVMVIPGENTVLLAVSVALACSVGMALPISTPPNAIAYATNMIDSKDMIKTGSIISVVCLLIILFMIRFLL